MIRLSQAGVYLIDGKQLVSDPAQAVQLAGRPVSQAEAVRGTMAYGILQAHNHSGDMQQLRLRFDSLTSHDITYVGIIQTARASGMTRFPMPYVLTNCHNSLCAVGGTINQDDHVFALSAARKYGGVYVPPNLAVIHSFNREMMAGCGRMILGSDSHTRYGALGTLAVGEGGGELAKQLVGRTYDIARPQVVCVYLHGAPRPGVGPQDVALAICGAVYACGYVKNRVMEFVGPGVASLPMDFRNGMDVMTTETTCWSSIWITDERTREYLALHGREEDYKPLAPAPIAYYDGCVEVDLSKVESMIALPMHPSHAMPIRELLANPAEILRDCQERVNAQISGAKIDLVSKVHDGGVWVEQAVIAGCSGGIFDNLCAAADILRGGSIGNGAFSLSVYPDSMPSYQQLMRNGVLGDLTAAGAIVRECFCGPCFGAGDTPANGELSIRHTTRNFPNREGSKPGEGQLSCVALMDARSIAATARNGGRLTPAVDLDVAYREHPAAFDRAVYDKRVFFGFGQAEPETKLVFGPNIRDWPQLPALSEDALMRVCSYITDPVTTTDELIPSGDTSSYRSNPERLSEFALSRKDPGYVGRAKAVRAQEQQRAAGQIDAEIARVYAALRPYAQPNPQAVNIGSVIFANKPGDGSAREQAASCQRVLGGCANLAREYATKRYRSNCINWGMPPLLTDDPAAFALGDWIFIPGLRSAVLAGMPEFPAYVIKPDGGVARITLRLDALTREERQIIADGCLINHYKNHREEEIC